MKSNRSVLIVIIALFLIGVGVAVFMETQQPTIEPTASR